MKDANIGDGEDILSGIVYVVGHLEILYLLTNPSPNVVMGRWVPGSDTVLRADTLPVEHVQLKRPHEVFDRGFRSVAC